MSEGRGTSPWVFIGVGCLVSVLLIVAVIVAIGAWGFSQVRELQRKMEDPVARTDAAMETLGAEELPDGYHAMMAMSVPFLVETAMITDREPDEDGNLRRFGEHGFIYFDTLSMGNQEQDLRDFFEGNSNDADFFDQTSIRVNAREFIDRGIIEEDGRTLRWLAYRGEVNAGDRQEFGEELNSMVMVECPGAERVRMGIWFGPDPDPDAPVDEVDFSGTVADPDEIQWFMGHFDLCRQ